MRRNERIADTIESVDISDTLRERIRTLKAEGNKPDELPDCTTPQRRTRQCEEEALTGHSRYSAYRMFKEDKSGVPEPGKLADLEVLDRDYMPIPANDIRDLKSLLSLVDGRIVYQSAEYSN